MNRDFVYNRRNNLQSSSWTRIRDAMGRWTCWACCGSRKMCSCCEKEADERDRPRVNQSTATAERMSRPRRPHTPGARKSTPEMLTAVRCALNQLQGEPAPTLAHPETPKEMVREPG